MVYFTSDLHLGHRNIHKYRDKFSSTEENDNYIIQKILELTKRDILYILGDFLFDCDNYNEYINRLSKKKCRIKLIMGNHDSKKLYQESIFEMQLPLFSYKNMWLSHCPIHPGELRNRNGNIHGHLHQERLQDNRYFNVNIDLEYRFFSLEEIREKLG